MDLERRGNLGVSRVLSNGPDIRPDPTLGRNIMSNEYVKLEDYHRWMKANDAVLKARSRQSFIAGFLLGVFVFVAIIMAGVSLSKIANNSEDFDNKLREKISRVNLDEELNNKVSKEDLDKDLEDELNQKVSKGDFEKEFKAKVSRETLVSMLECSSGFDCSCPSC